MIHVNVRGLIVRETENGRQLIIQLRKRKGEAEVYELPGGRINEYEKMVDGLRREIMEETGLSVKLIQGEAEGEPQREGDDSGDVHWADLEEVQKLIDEKRFSEIDLAAVLMFLRGEQMPALRAKVLQAEQERIEGAETMSIAEARKRLKESLNGI